MEEISLWKTGHLNAFIINKNPDYDEANPQITGSISYPLLGISPIEEGEHFTICKQHQTDLVLYVKNEYIKEHEDRGFKVRTEVSYAQLTVNKGDMVSILDNNCRAYILIKKGGLVGWVSNECLTE